MMKIERRMFLRGAGAALALPVLERFASGAGPEGGTPRRLLAICNNLGLLPEKFFPEGPEPSSPYLDVLREHRDAISVFSGVSHPDVDGSHASDICFLTAAPRPAGGGFRNTISLDQAAARHLGHLTRFPSLTLGVNVRNGGSLSWTQSGAPIPCEERPSAVFARLFLDGSPDERASRISALARGRSVMDAVAEQARSLRAGVGPRDRERLEQYFDGVRDLEERLRQSRAWEDVPKPAPRGTPPQDPASPREYLKKAGLMYDLARLAFESDATRLVTILLDGVHSPAIEVPGREIRDGYHSLTHHGRSAEKLAQLEAIDREHLRLLDGLLRGLRRTAEGGAPLLDRTMVLYGSNLGNANTHETTNLPILLAGGGFRHGRHVAFDRERNHPLPNLFISLLRCLGLPAERFASSTGTIGGLDPDSGR
jgi:hypothetical protein